MPHEELPEVVGLLFRSPSSSTPSFLVIKQIPKVKFWASLAAQMVKNLPAMWETWVQSLGWDDHREKGMTTHSCILAWRIPWTEEPGRWQSMGHKEGEIYLFVILFISLGKCLILQGEEERFFFSSIDCFWWFYCRRIPVLSENRC